MVLLLSPALLLLLDRLLLLIRWTFIHTSRTSSFVVVASVSTNEYFLSWFGMHSGRLVRC
jgi:hypothetical protein